MKSIVVFTVGLLFITDGLAQNNIENSNKRTLSITKTKEKINIDGLLDESVWENVKWQTDFIQIEPKPDQNANFKTEVKSLYNDKFLYFGIICYDSIGKNKFKAPDLKRDFNFQNHDLVGITIDGFNDQRNSVTFFVNPYGAQRDYLSFDDTYFDSDWNGLWRVKTSRTDGYWIAEFEIPWKTLRYKLNDDDQPYFGINFQRVSRSTNEKSAWSVYPRSVGFNRMEFAGILTDFVPPKPTTNIQVNPYALVSNNSESGTEFKAGGELKWAITPNLVIDATVNTDFAQADVDQLVNNLTRFSVLFPEKRQFFLENASLFGAGISGGSGSVSGNVSLIPFFSRRIGLDNNNRPVPIDYGGRVVYRSTKRNFGAMFLQQGSLDSIPGQNYWVARYSENIGKYNRIGTIITTNSTASLNGSPTYFDYTGALDGFFRLDGKNSLNIMFSFTKNDLEDDNGYAGFLQYQYVDNRAAAWLTSTLITNDYRPESGFISRKNIFANISGIEFNLRENWVPFQQKIRDYTPSISTEFYHEANTGNILEQKIALSPLSFNFLDGGKSKLLYSYNYQNIIEQFRPLGIDITVGKYTYNRYDLSYSSDASQKFSYDASYGIGGYFNGRLNSLDANVVYSPYPYVSLGMGVNNNEFKKVGISEDNKSVTLYSFNSRFALNPQLQLTFLYQRNSLNKSDIYNARLSWEYMPLSFVYLVFNSREYGLFEPIKEQNSIVKISFLKQF